MPAMFPGQLGTRRSADRSAMLVQSDQAGRRNLLGFPFAPDSCRQVLIAHVHQQLVFLEPCSVPLVRPIPALIGPFQLTSSFEDLAQVTILIRRVLFAIQILVDG